MRTAPIPPSALHALEDLLRVTCENALNLQLDDRLWTQACLPVARGGLGVRSPPHLAKPCFTASLHRSRLLIRKILPEFYHEQVEEAVTMTRAEFQSQLEADPPQDLRWASQKALDALLVGERSNTLLQSAPTLHERARLRAACHPLAGLWLQALPSSLVGLLLTPQQFQACVCLRLGGRLSLPYTCVHCGSPADAQGSQALACKFSRGRHSRHSELDKVLAIGLQAAGVPVRLEPAHLSLEDGKRPDGVTLIPFSRGRLMVWDATTVHTMAASYARDTAENVGAVSKSAESRKLRKYASLGSEYEIVPIALENLGSASDDTAGVLRQIAGRIESEKGRPHGRFFLDRISLALQVFKLSGLAEESLDDVLREC